MLPFDIWFTALVVLTLVDVGTTLKGLKSGATEANPIMRRVMKVLGVREALIVLKGGYLALAYFAPPESPTEQWAALGIYAAVAVNNLRVLRAMEKSN